MEKSRSKSGHVAQFFVAAELTRRGYDVSLDEDRRKTGLKVISPKGQRFSVQCRNKIKPDISWIVDEFEPTSTLYFAFVVADMNTPYPPPDYWWVRSDVVKKLYDAYMSKNPDAKSANLWTKDVEKYHNLEELPK